MINLTHVVPSNRPLMRQAGLENEKIKSKKMSKSNLLLIIDMQNDFCAPGGSLYVRGAGQDVKNLCDFIQRNGTEIDHMILTLDTHHVIDISHPYFWIDKSGDHPEPYTEISYKDVLEGKWEAVFSKEEATEYIKDLYEQGEFPHVVWPEHCIAGSSGAAVVEELMEVIIDWCREGRFYEVYRKGFNPLTEHFGALRANVPLLSDIETQLNGTLINTLQAYDNIIIAGEAKSHCVANTVKQMNEIKGLVQKLIILEDAMSDVSGFENFADGIFEKAIKRGARKDTASNLILKEKL